MNAPFDLNDYIMHHIGDSHEWHIPLFPPIHLPGFLTVHMLMLFISTIIMLMLFLVIYRKQDRVPTGITNFLEMIVEYIRDQIAIPNLGEKDGLLFTPMLCTLGFFILICNLMGLFPFFTAATSNINFTGPLAYLIFVLLVFGTLIRGGLKGMWNALVHPGLPVWMIPILLPLEIFSLFVRSAALCLRLFANMIAGHVLIASFLGLCILFPLWSVLSFPGAVIFYSMDIFVAFLQAYIFILLSAIFIGLMYHPKH